MYLRGMLSEVFLSNIRSIDFVDIFFVCILKSSFCIEAGANEGGYRGCRHPHDVPCKECWTFE